MSTKAAAETSSLDTAKLGVALLVLVGSLGAFYYFADAPKLYRVVGILVAVGVAVAIALQTDKGRQVAGFVKESQIEVRKVVWPTRQETVQTTIFVLIVVVIFGILLWVLDLLLAGLIQSII